MSQGSAKSESVSSQISAAGTVTDPDDTDNLGVVTSAGLLKKLSWANLKLALKAYLDTLYAPITPARGTWYAHTLTGYGSTANKITYFTTVVTNTPNSRFTVANSATNGLSVTANVAGLYAFTYFFDPSAGEYAGLSLNASSLTTGVTSLAAAQRIALGYGGSGGQVICVSTTLLLAVNDVVRPHNNGTAGGTAARCAFRVEFLG